MSKQNTQREMLQYFLKLNDAEKKSVLDIIKTFLKDKKEMFKRISIQQYNYELEEAEAEFERGEIYTHEEVIVRSKGWDNGR